MRVRRPVCRYFGGKWKIAPWVAQHFPPHNVYVEPFGGGASVLLWKARSRCEVYNDVEDDIVALFRILRDPIQAAELRHRVYYTPFSRAEFVAAYEGSDDPIEHARRFLIRSFMGFGSASHNRDHNSGFRGSDRGAHTGPAMDFAAYPAHIDTYVERLRGVIIEQLPALDLIDRYDGAEALFYCDPPYVASTREARRRAAYIHEMTDGDHATLAAKLHAVQGFAVVSGYRCELYDALYADWRRFDRDIPAMGLFRAKGRIESLWASPATVQHLQGVLF